MDNFRRTLASNSALDRIDLIAVFRTTSANQSVLVTGLTNTINTIVQAMLIDDGQPIINTGVRNQLPYTYTFETTGDHYVYYKLIDPTVLQRYTFCTSYCDSMKLLCILCRPTTIKSYFLPNLSTTFVSIVPTEDFRLTYKIIIPDSVTTIEDYGITGQSYSTPTVRYMDIHSVTNLGSHAFYDMRFDGLQVTGGKITFNNQIGLIPEYCFGCTASTGGYSSTGNNNIIIPNTITTVGPYAFFRQNGLLIGFEQNSQCTTIGMYAFSDIRNLTFTIPDSVLSVDQGAFALCSTLESINFSGNIQTIPVSFCQCQYLTLKRVNSDVDGVCNIPNGITSIENYAFEGSAYNFDEINIPEGCTTIGKLAFYNCDSGVYVNLPSTITYIGENAFSSVNSSRRQQIVTCMATTPPTLESGMPFMLSNVNSRLYVPAESVTLYKLTSGYSSYASKIEAIPT